MLARNPYLSSTFGNQVGDELTTAGVDATHYLSGFVYLNLQITGYWQVNSDGLKLSAEMTRQVGLSTLRAHQMAPAGVVPHSSSSELSAHQTPARYHLWKGYLAMMATMVPRRRIKTGKGRARGHIMWLPHRPRLGKGVERGHMMFLPHLARIFTFFSTRVVMEPGIVELDAKAIGPASRLFESSWRSARSMRRPP